jgi:transposase
MYIDKYPNNGIPYLRVVENYTTKISGRKKSGKRLIRNLGPLSRFDDGKPDFLLRLRKSFRDGAPIIENLVDLAEGKAVSEKVRVEFDKGDTDMAFSDPKNIGHFILDSLYDKLGIYDVLNLHKSRSYIEYDLNGHAKLQIFGRVLEPDSKSATWRERDRYLFGVVTSECEREIFRMLDVLNAKSETIQRRMNLKIANSIGRNTDICFYDVTNYWFEIDNNDEDVVDDNGQVVEEGMRKKGPSKAKTGKPITQMGLFIDSNGIPVAYRLFPGNNIDQTTLRPALKKTIGKMHFGRVVIVADGGLNSGKNLAHIISSGNGYIVSKSAKGSAKDVRRWILDEDGYVWNETGTFKSKSKIRTRTVEDENGAKVKLKEKIVSFWSKKQYDYAMHENKKFVEYLNDVIAHPDKLKDKQPKIKKFLEKAEVDKETGEIIEGTLTLLSLNMEKIKEYMDIMGYYTIMTSETMMDDREVIDKYHGLSRIEDSFRIIKSDLEGRPVFVSNPGHINAHFLICFIALTMLRLIQYKVLVSQGKETKNVRGWESGLTADKIKKALRDHKADALPGGYFRLSKPTEDLLTIMNAIGVSADLRIPTIKEVRQLKYDIDNANVM